MHMDWKDIMETPDGNNQEQGSDMVTDRTSSDSKKSTTGVKSSKSASLNPESPRDSRKNRKPGTIIWESHYGVSRYGLLGPRRGEKATQKDKPTLAKADVLRNDALDKSTRSTQSCSVNEKVSPGTTILPTPEGNKTANKAGDAPLEPPVTKGALAELEIAMVISNPRFRHDFNFGCNIPYAPKEKGGKSNEFWHTLRLQISELYSDHEAFIEKHPGNDWALPILLKEIGEILVALLPQRDSSVIKETLEVDLLMQQLAKGQLDLEQLADFFSETLRKHCAPSRDCTILEMAKQLTDGFHNGDANNTVDGLVKLLTTIEAMRLDVTNHQINHLTLAQSYVSTQQATMLKIISKGDIDVCGSYAWFDSNRVPDEIPALSREGGIWKFFRAFLGLLRHSDREAPIPDTLELDNERILDLRTKLLDEVNITICMISFKINEEKIMKRDARGSKGQNRSSRQVQSGSVATERNCRRARVRSALSALVDDCSNPGIDSSSLSASSPQGFDPWKDAGAALALEILRSANAPLPDPSFEEFLTGILSTPSNEDFLWAENAVFVQLGKHVQEYVNAWQSLDSLDLYKVAPVCPNGCKVHAKPKANDNLDKIARRIAHLGIIHWNVWGEIVYLVNPDEHPNHYSDTDWDAGEIANDS